MVGIDHRTLIRSQASLRSGDESSRTMRSTRPMRSSDICLATLEPLALERQEGFGLDRERLTCAERPWYAAQRLVELASAILAAAIGLNSLV